MVEHFCNLTHCHNYTSRFACKLPYTYIWLIFDKKNSVRADFSKFFSNVVDFVQFGADEKTCQGRMSLSSRPFNDRGSPLSNPESVFYIYSITSRLPPDC